MAETEKEDGSFKVPTDYDSKPSVNSDVTSNETETKSKDGHCKTDKTSSLNVPLPYKEPEWSGTVTSSHYFEVIKNGTFVDNLDLKKSFIVFGRLDVCDVVFEHPSVSRYHAIVQYCKGDDLHPKGFYLYDLGSTHGTFLNKEKVKPKIYYKLKVGYLVKFGGSSRLHIFQGQEESEPEEKKSPSLHKVSEESCNWGMGEDAEEEEDLTENPFALSTPNEELYLDDPKKTLRGWFEREGYELEYDVEEKGYKTFVCRVQLPVDNAGSDFLPVEASVSGKKKEAVIACALEACRTLDQLGLLRQSHHESRQRKKKKWEENDYYDSDEDTFLDRTGTIEKKREKRKRLDKKSEVETFQSLETKVKLVTEEIDDIKTKLSAFSTTVQSSSNTETDSLEEFMFHLSDSSKTTSDKIEKTKLKFRLVEAEKEVLHLEKLLNIARPTKLPPFSKYPGMVGKKLKSKYQVPVAKPILKKIDSKFDENEEEVESDSETNDDDKTKSVIEMELSDNKSERIKDESEKTKISKNYGLIMKAEYESNKKEQKEEIIGFTMENSSGNAFLPRTKKSGGHLMKESDAEISDQNVSHPKNISDNAFMPRTKKSVGHLIKESDAEITDQNVSHPKQKKKNSFEAENIDVYKTTNPEYSTWVPPSGQSGDGMTHLNAKYGY